MNVTIVITPQAAQMLRKALEVEQEQLEDAIKLACNRHLKTLLRAYIAEQENEQARQNIVARLETLEL